jgi:hypothetical protein
MQIIDVLPVKFFLIKPHLKVVLLFFVALNWQNPPSVCHGQTTSDPIFKIKIGAGDLNRSNDIVRTLLWLENAKARPVALTDESNNTLTGQISTPNYADVLASADESKATGNKKLVELTFVLPSLAAGKSITLAGTETTLNATNQYKWHDDGSTRAELQHDGNPVMAYMYEEVDDGSPERRKATYKVFHHIYSPNGDRLLTKGPGGLFPHHRGIFFGFNRISYGENQQADVWHCNKGESQINRKLVVTSNPVFGQSRSLIDWNGRDGKPFAKESRELTAIKLDNATVIDFRTSLVSLVDQLKLDGDPQHAGVQFRASQLVPDKTKHLTYYNRPDGQSAPGKFRNWSNKKNESDINKSHINLPFLAMTIAVPNSKTDGQKSKNSVYTIAYLSDDANPKPSRFSERDYGRFGSYFEATVVTEAPLNLHYRYWVLDGASKTNTIQNLSDQFANPVKVEVIK